MNSAMGVPDPILPTARVEERPPAASAANPFGQIVFLYQSNEFLLSELEGLRQKRARALVYRQSPGSNPILADARIEQLRARQSAVLTMLRANRIAARLLLGRAPAGPNLSR